MSTFLLIPLGAFLDRLRGDNRGPGGFIESVAYGLVLAVASMGMSPEFYKDWTLWAFALGFAIGETPGWSFIGDIMARREPTGDPEWWQKGKLKTSLWLAAIARGCMWALPCLPAVYFNLDLIYSVIAIPLAFVGSLLTARALSDDPWITHIKGSTYTVAASRWKKMEWIRGAQVVIITLSLKSCLLYVS